MSSPTTVITFSDAAMVKRLEPYQAPGESPSLTAKRLLNDHLDALERGGAPVSPSIDTALAELEALERTLVTLRAAAGAPR